MKPRHIYIPLIAGAVTPSAVVFFLEMFGSRRPPSRPPSGTTLSADFIFIALTLIPFVVLIMATATVSAKLRGWRLECVFWGGLVAVTGFTAYGHASVWWPLYFGGHMSSTAVVAFIFIPFYALGALLVGLFVVYVISLCGGFRVNTL